MTDEVELENDALGAGPQGPRVYVIDYDSTTRTYYRPISPREFGTEARPRDPFQRAPDSVLLDSPAFHAQNVYALASHTLSRFEHALGRRVSFGGGHQIAAVPHAFADANAFYSDRDYALLFRLLSGPPPGADGVELPLPRCDRARDGPRPARQPAPLTGVLGDALRKSLSLIPSKRYLKDPAWREPRRRGEVFVAAMLHAFVRIWLGRIQTLPALQGQQLYRAHVVAEGVAAAERLLATAARAIDYGPPLELDFDEYLSALRTADTEASPDDTRYELRAALRSSFAAYGMKPRSPFEGRLWEPAIATLEGSITAPEREDVFRFLYHIVNHLFGRRQVRVLAYLDEVGALGELRRAPRHYAESTLFRTDRPGRQPLWSTWISQRDREGEVV